MASSIHHHVCRTIQSIVSPRVRIPAVRTIAGLLLALAMPLQAQALPKEFDPDDLPGGPYYSGNPVPDFYYQVYGIPDLDQKRVYLSNNGKNHCVPTSAMDTALFLSQHGYPELASQAELPILAGANLLPFGGTLPDYDADQYLGQTYRISYMGSLMDTSGSSGTSWSDGIDGWVDFLEGHTSKPFIIFEVDADDEEFTPGWLAPWLQLGGQVNLSIGWMKGEHHDSRDGGHRVVPTGVELKSNVFGVYYRDPAQAESPNDLWAQSTYKDKFREATYNTYSGLWCLGDEPSDPDKAWGCITRFLVVFPLMGVTNVFDSNDLEKLVLTLVGFNGKDYIGLDQIAIDPPTKGKIKDMAFDPVRPRVTLIMDDSDELFTVELGNGLTKSIGKLERPEQLTYGGKDMRLYVMQPGQVSILPRGGERGEVVPVDPELEAMAYDPVHDRLIMASQSRVAFFDPDLNELGVLASPLGEGRGPVSIRVDPVTGEVLMMRAGQPTMARVEIFSERDYRAEAFKLPEVDDPQALDVDSAGRIYVSDGGALKVFRADGTPEKEAELAGAKAGTLLRLPRTFSTRDQKSLEDEENLRWVLPEDANAE